MLAINPIQDFPTTFVKNALDYSGCTEPQRKSEAPACYVEIVTYNGKELSLEAWCAKFVWFIFDKTSKQFGVKNPLKYTASTKAMKADAQTKNIRVDKKASPGSIFFKYRDGGGHVGIVSSVDGKYIQTVEGNHNDKVASVRRNYTSETYYFIHVEDLFVYNRLIFGINSKYALIAAAGITGMFYLFKGR